jgi:hypothetical protein
MNLMSSDDVLGDSGVGGEGFVFEIAPSVIDANAEARAEFSRALQLSVYLLHHSLHTMYCASRATAIAK